MPILAHLSRRFNLLTTDAQPDPPRVQIEGYTHNLEPEENSKSKSVPATPDPIERTDVTSERKESPPNGAIPTDPEYPSTEQKEQKEQKRPNVKTKTKSRQNKYSQASNVVNYNIVNSSGVKIGARTSYICNVNQVPAGNTAPSDGFYPKPKFRQMPADVDHLSYCVDEITLEDIFVIKTHVGHGWRDVARRLSYSDGQIDQFEENYRHRGVDEVIYQLLLDWKQANTKSAEIGNLVRVLWACQEYDCVERLVTVHKNLS